MEGNWKETWVKAKAKDMGLTAEVGYGWYSTAVFVTFLRNGKEVFRTNSLLEAESFLYGVQEGQRATKRSK